MRSKTSFENLLFAAFDLAVIAMLLAWKQYIPLGFSPTVFGVNLAIIAVYFMFSAFSKKTIWRGIKITISTELGFSVFYYLLFYNVYTKDLLGSSPYWKNTMIAHTFAEWANRGIVMATVGYVAFHLGTMLASKPVRNFDEKNQEIEISEYKIFDIFIALAFFLLTSIFLIFNLQSSDTDRYGLDHAHAVLAQANADSGTNPTVSFFYLIIIMLCVLIISRIILTKAAGYRLSITQWLMIFNAFIWTLHMITGGDRNNFLIVLLATAGGFCAFIRRIPWLIVFMGAISALMLYQIVEVTRMMPDMSTSSLISALTDQSPAEEERSSSFETTTITLRATFAISPNVVPFAMGYYKLVGISGIFPGSRKIIVQPGSGFRTSAEALTYHTIGTQAGWSVGSNIISDLYMDFGTIGVVGLMALIGWFSTWSRMTIAVNGLNLRRIYIYICTLANVSELPRYSFDAPVRMLVWGILVIAIYEFIFVRRRRQPQGEELANNERS